MNETFSKWLSDANRITHELRLMVKNGIRYKASLTTNKKPRKRKIKAINAKKWQVKGIFLHDFEIIDEKEIALIIKNDSNEQALYDKAFAITKRETYNLLLTDKQYKAFCKFIETEKLALNQEFYLQRKLTGLKTIYQYETVK